MGQKPRAVPKKKGTNLDFFNDLAGTLRIELTEPTQNIAPALANQKASPSAQIESLELQASIFLRDTSDFRELTPAELELVVFKKKNLRLRGLGDAVSHDAPNGESFTIRDLLAAVEETERQTRAQSAWYEGVDVHHVFFEGIHSAGGGTWEIFWGS